MTVRPKKIDLFDEKCNDVSVDAFLFDGLGIVANESFDTRHHLSRFSPNRYWMTVSTGSVLVTFVRYRFWI